MLWSSPSYTFAGVLATPPIRCRGIRSEVFCEKGVLKNFAKFTGKHLFRVSFLIKLQAEACNFFRKETLTQMFLCAFCEIFKNTYFYETPLVAASVDIKNLAVCSTLQQFNHRNLANSFPFCLAFTYVKHDLSGSFPFCLAFTYVKHDLSRSFPFCIAFTYVKHDFSRTTWVNALRWHL